METMKFIVTESKISAVLWIGKSEHTLELSTTEKDFEIADYINSHSNHRVCEVDRRENNKSKLIIKTIFGKNELITDISEALSDVYDSSIIVRPRERPFIKNN
jgi:hypothetical protein